MAPMKRAILCVMLLTVAASCTPSEKGTKAPEFTIQLSEAAAQRDRGTGFGGPNRRESLRHPNQRQRIGTEAAGWGEGRPVLGKGSKGIRGRQ